LVGLVGDLENKYGYSASSEYHATAKETAEESEEDSSMPSIGDLLDSIPSAVTDAIKAYNNGPIGVVGGMFGVDNLIFDNLSKTEIDGEAVVLRKDLSNFADAYNDVYEIYSIINNDISGSISNLDWDKIDKTMNEIFDGGLVKGFATNLIADVVVNYDKFGLELDEYGSIITALKSILENEERNIQVKEYFLHDIKSLYSIVAKAGRSGLVDEFLDNELSTVEKVGKVVSDEYKDNLKYVISTIFDLNVFKDISKQALDLVVDTLKDETHFINTNTEVEDWSVVSTNLNSAIDELVKANNTIKVADLISDPLKVLGLKSEKIDTAFTALGTALDKIDEIGILVSEGNKTLLSELLDKFGYAQYLYKREPADSSSKPFESYTKLCQYIAGPIKEVCELNLYADMKSDKNKLVVVTTKLAELTDANEGDYPDTLKNIVMSLYKLDVFRDMLLPMFKDSVSSFIDLDSLEVPYNYSATCANWENDCEMLTRMLVKLHKIEITKDDKTTTLDNELLSDGADFAELIKKINNSSELGDLVKSLLYTKCATPISNNLFTVIEEAVSSILSADITINPASATFIEGNTEDQATEVANVFVKFIDLLKGEPSSLDSIDKIELGKLLDTLKVNAYRVELNSKTQTGIFKSTFDAFYNKLKENDTIEEILSGKQPYEINYEDLMTTIKIMEDATAGTFANELKNLMSADSLSSSDLDNLFNTITAETATSVENLTTLINDLEYSVSISDSTIKNEIENRIDDKVTNSSISTELANKLKTMFGITAA